MSTRAAHVYVCDGCGYEEPRDALLGPPIEGWLPSGWLLVTTKGMARPDDTGRSDHVFDYCPRCRGRVAHRLLSLDESDPTPEVTEEQVADLMQRVWDTRDHTNLAMKWEAEEDAVLGVIALGILSGEDGYEQAQDYLSWGKEPFVETLKRLATKDWLAQRTILLGPGSDRLREALTP